VSVPASDPSLEPSDFVHLEVLTSDQPTETAMETAKDLASKAAGGSDRQGCAHCVIADKGGDGGGVGSNGLMHMRARGREMHRWAEGRGRGQRRLVSTSPT
jgi:hypothetical protein